MRKRVNFGRSFSENLIYGKKFHKFSKYFSADYSAVGQLRGYLENIVCREVEAIDGGAQIADLDQGILAGFKFNIGY